MFHRSPKSLLFAVLSLSVLLPSAAQSAMQAADESKDQAIPEGFTRQDQLRGSITPEREWWDLMHYDLSLQVFPKTKSIAGSNIISFRTVAAGDRMQVDLQEPLAITRVVHGDTELKFEREGNVYWIQFAEALAPSVEDQIQIYYEGTPVESTNPPWSGGFTWDKDESDNPFIATTCQGIGASIWWPNKDHGADEPDRGVDVHVTVPKGLVAVSNGRLQSTSHDKKAKTSTFHWRVLNPINNYSVNVNIGNYVSIQGVYDGKFGKLDLEYWVLKGQEKKARKQFKQLPMTLEAFEHWFGKYPFYEDSFKLVVVPYLGMEHQSSVTYGNGFKNGYRGTDLSKTGVGLKFDYIIIHEAAHEWWGNNISMKDTADMWIHESFGTYAESLYVEYHFSKEEADNYTIGTRRRVANRKPIIGKYDLNHEGAGDMYQKGSNILHTMRHVLNNDEKWHAALLGLQQEFWHKTVTTAEVEDYISRVSGFDFSLLFDQYLRTPNLPQLNYSSKGKSVSVWFDKVVPGFSAPVVLHINGKEQRVLISETPKEIALKSRLKSFELDRNFYMTVVTKK
ncbi:MAG: M1 family metallopeptidase [Planctomycetes bacterium]|nr:M1 family metallopeptidase [Planctomycetota bacterium]MCP4860440.1 M1 family metallopeptidase [Planctomycetota bacterium]